MHSRLQPKYKRHKIKRWHMNRNEKKKGLNLYQALFILATSYAFALITYYLPIDALNKYSFCEIYTFEALPFALILGVILYYIDL